MKLISSFCCCKKVFTHMKYEDNLEKFSETLLEKGEFYSHLSMEDINDT